MRKIEPSIFTEKDVDEALARLKVAILYQMNVKGNEAFYSPCEGLGVITEEYHEVIDAIHRNDSAETAKETMDLAVASIWQHMTSRDYLRLYARTNL